MAQQHDWLIAAWEPGGGVFIAVKVMTLLGFYQPSEWCSVLSMS